MRRRTREILLVAALCAGLPGARLAWAQEPIRELRIDPLLLVSVKEFRNIVRTIGPEIYPGWNPLAVPLLLYRPRVQDVLLNARHRPPGFARYTGPSVLEGEEIYARNDSTIKDVDGQNTSMDLDSMRVLVVADQFSRERQSLTAMLGRPADLAGKWLSEWGFIESPYGELGLLLHEAFHVYQDSLAPEKGADERDVARYPLLDARNNALVALEAELLRAAVRAENPARRRERAGQFVAVRKLRRSYLDSAAIAYEDLNEFSEGTARYVELRFLRLAERVTPVPEMYLRTGFSGYKEVAGRLLSERLDDLVKVASFSDDRFGNRFGAGPMRYRLYETGAAQALLLDEIAPDWKQRIFAPGVYLTDLLAAALPAPAARRDSLVAQARAEFGYDSVLANRRAMEAEGRRIIQGRVDAILNTAQTLVTVDYAAAGGIKGMGFTPFGVTAVRDSVAIYDLVPIAVRFANGVLLRLKTVVPVLVDRRAQTLSFAVASPARAFSIQPGAQLDLPELTLGPSPGTAMAISGNHVRLTLR